MGESPKKEESVPKNSNCANNPFRVALLAGLALTGAFLWHHYSSDPEADLGRVTRPTPGFEVVADLDDDEIAMEMPLSNSPHPLFEQNTQEEAPSPLARLENELSELKSHEQQLQLLLQEKDALIAELTRQLAEGKTEPVATPVSPPSQETETVTTVTETAPASVVEEADANLRTHTVKKGETLTEISKAYYGTGTLWQKIYDANSEKLSDKNKLRVGTTLTIPAN